MHYSLICTGKGKQHYAPELSEPVPCDFLRLEVNVATICGSDYMVLQGTHPYKNTLRFWDTSWLARWFKTVRTLVFSVANWSLRCPTVHADAAITVKSD